MNTTYIPQTHRNLIVDLFQGGDKLLPKVTNSDFSIMHAAIGMSGEAGELVEALTPMRQHKSFDSPVTGEWWSSWLGHPGFDIANVREEIGDYLFYEGALRIELSMEVLPCTPRSEYLWSHHSDPSRVGESSTADRREMVSEMVSLSSLVSSQILDATKKVVMYRKELDRDKMEQLLVDSCWVMSELADLIHSSESDLRLGNIEKLSTGKNARYKDGYSDEAAAARADKADQIVSGEEAK